MSSAIVLPVDLSGKSPANLIKDEIVTTVNRQVRVIIPEYGAFYANSVVVKDLTTGKTLTKGSQFLAAEMYIEPTMKSGQEVCAIIMIVDPDVSNQVSITYQAFGGENSYSLKALQQLINDAAIDDRPIEFYSIQGRPRRYPVAPHQHDGSTVYGWDYVVNELKRLTEAVNAGNAQARLDALNVIARAMSNVSTDAETLIQRGMDQHLSAVDPHRQYVTKAELASRIGLVRKPTCSGAATGGKNVLTGSPYFSFYGVSQAGAHFQVSRQNDFVALLVDRTFGAVTSYSVAEVLPPTTQLYVRVRYRDQDNVWSDWSDAASFTSA